MRGDDVAFLKDRLGWLTLVSGLPGDAGFITLVWHFGNRGISNAASGSLDED